MGGLVSIQRWGLRLFPPSARGPPSFSAYALPFTPRAALLAPICCDSITESREIFFCQPCLGLNLEDPALA